MRTCPALLLRFLLLCLPMASAIATPPPSKAEVARYAQDFLDHGIAAQGPGAAVLIARGDEVLYRGARGEASLELGVPLSPAQVFRIGSISKQFAAAGLLKLVERGKLSLDDPLAKFVPDYPNGGNITVRMLLNHTSGIKSIFEVEDDHMQWFIDQTMSTTQLIDSFRNDKPDFAPGSDWHYNNSGYVLIGAIIESVTGMPWHVYLKQTLFDPLGMAHTGLGDEAVTVISGHVTGYGWRDGHWATARHVSMTQPHAAGALVSTVDDLLRWNRALHEGKVLKPGSYRQMITPTGAAAKDHYGFGLVHETWRGTDMLQHGGDIYGFSGFLVYLPREQLTVAVLYNTDFDDSDAASGSLDVEMIARTLAAQAIGKPYPEKEAIPLDAATLKEYEGVYRMDKDSVRVLRVVDGKLVSQRTASPAYALLPIAKDTFLFEKQLSRMVFQRDASGKVVAMRFFANDEGKGDVVARTEEPLPVEHIAMALPKAALQRVLGRYAGEGTELAVMLDGDALKAQMTGQPAVALFAESPTRFFLKVVDATLDFAPGDVPETATLRQDGDVVEFKRKP